MNRYEILYRRAAVFALALGGALAVGSMPGCSFGFDFTMLHVTVTDAETGAPIAGVTFVTSSDGEPLFAACEEEPASGPCPVFVVPGDRAMQVLAPGYATKSLPESTDTDEAGGADVNTSIALSPVP